MGEVRAEVQLLEVEDDAVHGVIVLGAHRVEFLANVAQRGDELHVSQRHVKGAGPRTVGVAGIRAIAQAVMRELGVTTMVVDGGDRYSGAAHGRAGGGRRSPGRLYFKLESP